MRRPEALAALAAILSCLAATPAWAQESWERNLTRERASAGDFGGVGLLQTRTARFSEDGRFTFGAAFLHPYDVYSLSWQFLPWLEATFRYSKSETFDKSLDLKFRLLHETRGRPEVALGFQDVLGTGLFSGEYLVASKRFGDFDLSLGVVWGYGVGGDGLFRNPFTWLSDRFDERTVNTTGDPGFEALFTGREIDLFGGVEYHTPVEGLSVKVEYDPNDYEREPHGALDHDLPVNFGLAYRLWHWVEAGLAYERGNTVMARLTLRADFNADARPPKPADPRPPKVERRAHAERAPTLDRTTGVVPTDTGPVDDVQVHAAAADEYRRGRADGHGTGAPAGSPAAHEAADRQPVPEDARAIAEKVFAELPAQGLTGVAFRLARARATVVVAPMRFPEPSRNVGRAARVVARHAPPDVEEISVVLRARGIDLTAVTLVRRHMEDMALGSGSPEETLRSARFERPRPLPPDALSVRNDHAYPRFDWGLNPAIRHHVGAPEHPYLFQLRAQLSGGVEVLPGLRASADLGFDIYNEYDRISRGPKGQLEPVRSNVKEYLQQGRHVLAGAQADYLFSLAPDWYARAAVGYFETMFGGVSGEVLYRRQDSRWAAGVEVSHVWQRDFDQLLGFRDYDTTTGHVSLYYELPWHDLEAAVHGGRYLARDWGATFQLSRRFRSGIEFGGFFTLTNVSDAEFGEGGFDKGLFFRVPLNLLLPYSTRESAGTIFRPLTGDGGQMLAVGPKLYEVTEEGQLDALHRRPLGLRD